ncbi:MAG: stalk domain-containing protein [Clostridia bacterium]|jgi:hypothetical protein|nr:stalk domain-containing protein [Clostridia bacterium]
MLSKRSRFFVVVFLALFLLFMILPVYGEETGQEGPGEITPAITQEVYEDNSGDAPLTLLNPGALELKEKIKSLPENQKKMDLSLLTVWDEATAQNIFPPGEDTRMRGLKTSGREQIYVYVYLDEKTAPAEIEPYLAEIVNISKEDQLLTGWVALADLEDLSLVRGVRKISQVKEPIIWGIDKITSEGDAIHRADLARLDFDQQGAGVKVGVISDSVDHWRTAFNRGELPEITVLSNNYPHAHSDEGIALLEIIHDLAPEAELYFHDCGGDIIGFNNAVAALIEAGCQVIVDDVAWQYEPFFEDGTIASYVQSVTDDVIYVSSAGNSADRHYQGQYFDYTVSDGMTTYHFHDFSHGTDPRQKSLLLKVPWDGGVEIVMQWDEAFGKAGEDFDMWVYDLTYGSYVLANLGYTFPANISQTYGHADQDGNDDPLESFVWANNNEAKNPQRKDIDLAVSVLHPDGDSASEVEFYFYLYDSLYGGSTVLRELNLVAADSVYGHPAVPGVLAVGAIAADDSGHDDIRYYSSQGPVTIRSEAEKRIKPDLCGIDGVTVTWGLPESDTKPDTYHFRGTSASAPHVAAIAALLLAEYPGSTPGAIRQVLKDSAIHLSGEILPDPFEPNNVFGYGLADALAALQSFDTIPPVLTAEEQTVTVAPGQLVSFQVNEACTVYMVKEGVIPAGEEPEVEVLKSTLPLYLGAKGTVQGPGGDGSISSTGLVPGTYYLYAVDQTGNITAGVNTVQVHGTAVNTASTVTADKRSIRAEGSDKATFTVQLLDAAGQSAGCNWVYVVTGRPEADMIAPVQDAPPPISEGGHHRFLAGEDGKVQFTVSSVTAGTSVISAGLGAGAIPPLIDNNIELTFYVPPVVTVLDTAATDAEGQYVRLSSNRSEGEVYIILSSRPHASVEELEAAVSGNKGRKAAVTAAGMPVPVPTSGLPPGSYYAFAGWNGYLSNPADEMITISDGVNPVVTVIDEKRSFTNSKESINIQSNEDTGKVYLIRGEPAVSPGVALFDAAIIRHEGAAGNVTAADMPVLVYTQGLRQGTYYAYAADGAGNISEPWPEPIRIEDVLPPLILSFHPADNAVNVAVDTPIAITFSEPILYPGGSEITNENAASLLAFSKNDIQGETVACSVKVNDLKTVLTVLPASSLEKGQKYFLGVDAFIEDEGGNPLSGVNTASFTIVRNSGGGGGSGGGSSGGTPAPPMLVQPIPPVQAQIIQLTIAQAIAMINQQSRELDAAPVIINGRTMVPLRFIGEALGAQINWVEVIQAVYLYLDGKTLRLVIGEMGPGLDSPPVIINGRTMVPIRYIAETFGAKVEWLEDSKTVLIVK